VQIQWTGPADHSCQRHYHRFSWRVNAWPIPSTGIPA